MAGEVRFTYFKGRCRIIFKKGRTQGNSSLYLSNISIIKINIHSVVEAFGFDIRKHRAGGFIYFDSITLAVTDSSDYPYVQFLKDQDFIYTKDIFQVLIKHFRNNQGNFGFDVIGDNLYETSGEIWFALPEKIRITEKPTEVFTPAIDRSNQGNVSLKPKDLKVGKRSRNLNVLPSYIDGASENLSTGCGWFCWIARILLFIFLFAVGDYLIKEAPILGILITVLLIVFLLYWIIYRFRYQGFFALMIMACFMVFRLFLILSNEDTSSNYQEKDGSVRQEPPVEYEYDENGSHFKDFRNDKHVEWFDFADRFYAMDYYTLSSQFIDSREERNSIRYKRLSSDLVDYYHDLYKILVAKDNSKLDSLTASFKQMAEDSSLSDISVAEMVTTFIQEIDYVLVHDLSCEDGIAQSGNQSFFTQYHKSGMPCLPQIFGGIQSPYEFLHNLKGDCDTRALFAFALLTKLNISSSVWVSEQYGHSVVGIGLPAGIGSYKTVGGVKHYAVELTVKGYRIGMISPDHVNMQNWDVALFKNF